MTDDRKPLPAEAEMVPGATYRHRYSGRDFVFVGKAAADMDGLNVAAGRPVAVFQDPDGTLFAREWALAADGRFALTAAPKATETPGLRAMFEAQYAELIAHCKKYAGKQHVIDGLWDTWQECAAALSATPQPVAAEAADRNPTNDQIAAIMLMSGTDEQRDQAMLYAAGVLLKEPQPVAIPDDGAGRDEVVAWLYKPAPGAANCTIAKVDRVPEIGPGWAETPLVRASALSAERAAHEETRQGRDEARDGGGWRVVPVKATERMLMKADGLTDLVIGFGGDAEARRQELSLAWDLMLEAAPSPPAIEPSRWKEIGDERSR